MELSSLISEFTVKKEVEFDFTAPLSEEQRRVVEEAFKAKGKTVKFKVHYHVVMGSWSDGSVIGRMN